MILHGRNLIIIADGAVLAGSRSCTINVQADSIPAASPDDGQWQYSIVGRKSWRLTTNHLVVFDPANGQGPKADVARVGQVMTLRMGVGLPFKGLNPEGRESSSPHAFDTEPDIYLMTPTGEDPYFVAKQGTALFTDWTSPSGNATYYIHPELGRNFFSNDGNCYYYSDQSEVLVAWQGGTMQGEAICQQWKGTFTLGNLAQGSFEWLGNGPLE